MRPWNQPTTFSSASRSATRSQQRRLVVEARDTSRPWRSRNARIVAIGMTRSQIASRAASRPAPAIARLRQHLMPDQQRRAERAAGVAGRRLNPDLLERAFAQDPAVADAVERHAAGQDEVASTSVSACRWRAHFSITSSHTTWTDAARSISRCVTGDSGLARRPAEQRVELRARHRQAGAVVEVRLVHPERAVVPDVDQVLADRAARSAARRTAPGPSPCIRRSSPGSRCSR